MFRTRNFLPVFVAAAFVVALSLAGLAESDACAGDWKCWFIVPFKILFSIGSLLHRAVLATWLPV